MKRKIVCPVFGVADTLGKVIDQSDQELLRAYADERSEAAFAELTRRYVDFVYSVALRVVRDEQPAQDVAQAVFVALAKSARKLSERQALVGWLHVTTQNQAATAVRSDVRRRAREQEAAVMNESSQDENGVAWEQIAPELDRAIEQLREGDRDALLLRYFQHKSIREVAGALATTEDAAQKRVNRALERLREIMARRGVAAGVGGLAAIVAANAVKAAPEGTASAIASASVSASATQVANGGVIMQKVVAATALAVAVAAGLCALHLEEKIESLARQNVSLTGQLAAAERERDEALGRLALRQAQIGDSEKTLRDLARLRAEVSRLREATNAAASIATKETEQAVTRPPVALQVVVESKFISLPDQKLDSLGIVWTEDGNGDRHGLLTSNQVEGMKQSLADDQIDVLSMPKVTTLNGLAATLSAGDDVKMSPSLTVVAHYSTNDLTFDLTVAAKYNEMAADPGQSVSVTLSNEMTFARGETAVLAREIPTSARFSDQTNASPVARSLLVTVSPELIDPAGNLLPYQ